MAMMKTRHFVIERAVGTAYFRVRRTPAAIESLDEYERDMRAMSSATMRIATDRLGLLLDLREGPMRNDEDFETRINGYRDRLFQRFRRVAVLLKTPAGKLQAMRLNKGFENVGLFTDEKEAIAFLTARD